MIVISDASPIRYLLLIDCLELLPELYGKVIIPEVVRDELIDPGAPVELQEFIANPPGWLIVRSVNSTSALSPSNLDPGERAAISLAQEYLADLLIIDERAGRRAAKNLGIPIVGTLGILEAAAAQGKLDLAEAIAQLKATNFRVSPSLINTLLKRYSDK